MKIDNKHIHGKSMIHSVSLSINTKHLTKLNKDSASKTLAKTTVVMRLRKNRLYQSGERNGSKNSTLATPGDDLICSGNEIAMCPRHRRVDR